MTSHSELKDRINKVLNQPRKSGETVSIPIDLIKDGWISSYNNKPKLTKKGVALMKG